MSREEAELLLRFLAGRAAPAEKSPEPPPAAPPDGPPLDLPAGPVAPITPGALRALVEAVPDALVVTDATGRVVLVNAQAEQLFGYARAELLGQPVEVLVPERFRAGHVGQRRGFLAAPHARPMGQSLELLGRRKDGREVPVEIGLSPLSADGGPLVVAGVRDVTVRRRTEAELKRMEARYRTLVEGIPAVTFLAAMDEGASEIYVSPYIEKLLGFSQKEWVENPILWYAQLHPDDRERWHEEFSRTVARGDTFASEYRFLARDGRVVWVRGEARMARDDAGRPLFLQGVAFDITAIKEAEEMLRAANATLAERVAERTRELARSNADLEAFGYRVSHDLQAPLRSIKSYTQKLAEATAGRLGPEADDWMGRIIKGANRMGELIRALLAYSRVTTHGREFQATNCAAACATAVANLQADIEESGGTVAAGTLPVVRADESQFVQLLQNLIGNALKYRANRAPEVRVAAEQRGGEWLFSVADNGIGVEGEFLERIFKLGERLHSEARYAGSGIGLATCAKIVERHGGRIWATSPGPDQGMTAWFTLPAAG
jgi:PAS domain S-box-containing protein